MVFHHNLLDAHLIHSEMTNLIDNRLPPPPPEEVWGQDCFFRNVRSDGNCLFDALLVVHCDVSDEDISQLEVQQTRDKIYDYILSNRDVIPTNDCSLMIEEWVSQKIPI